MSHRSLHSSTNQPDRIFLDSSMVVLTPSSVINYPTDLDNINYQYNSISITLKQPVLGCKGVCLTSFIQCNNAADGPCIPDYIASDAGFFYYKWTGTLPTPPVTANLKRVLMDPSYFIVTATGTARARVNRYFTSYSDFVDCLNASAVYAGAGTADVVFSYDSVTKQINFHGVDAASNYMAAGYNESDVRAVFNASTQLKKRTPVPYGNTLNSRMGFTNSINNITSAVAGVGVIQANGYPNLARTNAVTLRTNINGQSTLNTLGSRDVLGVVPISVPFLGINNYQNYFTNYLCDMPDSIQDITVSFFDDAGQPYAVHNNVCSTLEILCKY